MIQASTLLAAAHRRNAIPALIATGEGAGGGNSSTTSSTDTTGANLIVIGVSWYNANTADGVVSDSKGNTWVPLTATSLIDVSHQLFYCFNPVVGSGHTFTFTANQTFAGVQMAAFSGLHSSPFVDESQASMEYSLVLSPGEVTPTVVPSLVVCSAGFDYPAPSTTAIDSGFTKTGTSQWVSSTTMGISLAYKVVSSDDPVNPEWTLANDDGYVQRLISSIAVFK